MKYFNLGTEVINSQARIILGLPSFGNIGQQAVDCLIATLSRRNDIRRIGFCESEYLLPMVGFKVDSFSSSQVQLCHPIEVYQSDDSQSTLIVIVRSLCYEGEETNFSDDICSWLKTIQYSDLYILSGADQSFWDIQSRYEKNIESTFLLCTENALNSKSIQHNSWDKVISTAVHIPIGSSLKSDINASDDAFPSGMETAIAILKNVITSDSNRAENVIILGKFTASGYHTPNALGLSSLMLDILSKQTALSVPSSWSLEFNS